MTQRKLAGHNISIPERLSKGLSYLTPRRYGMVWVAFSYHMGKKYYVARIAVCIHIFGSRQQTLFTSHVKYFCVLAAPTWGTSVSEQN